MTASPLHEWNLSPADARTLQTELAERVDDRSPLDFDAIRTVVAVDVSMNRFATWMAAAAVVCDVGERKVVEFSTVVRPIRFPYVSGLLSFRELPAVLEAIDALKSHFDAVVVDGHGVAHPRRFGIASHLGLWLDRPTIGFAKTRLFGDHAAVPNKVGATVPLTKGDEQIGAVLRTRLKASPIFVSVGHRCRLEDAVTFARKLTDGRRIPWPIRAAHEAANHARVAFARSGVLHE